MNDSSNSSWTFYSENLDLHIAAPIRSLRLIIEEFTPLTVDTPLLYSPAGLDLKLAKRPGRTP